MNSTNLSLASASPQPPRIATRALRSETLSATTSVVNQRRMPVGAEIQAGGGVHFRVWTPASTSVSLEILSSETRVEHTFELTREPDGYFSGCISEAGDSTLYKFRLESGSYPDPASRFQPYGPHGPSQVVNPHIFPWTDRAWRGRPVKELVIYEMHLGTFTPEGTWRAATEQLPELRRLGITLIEIMPIADFAGDYGWGYDGVDLFAPARIYGTPDDARSFINRAHELGLMVILDVVYNHLGPEGNYLRQFSANYFSTFHSCEWGEALNFDGENARPVREFYVTNARYWIEEFHFDGLRLDATQQIYDRTDKHIIEEIAEAARAAAPDRIIYLVAENEPQEVKLVRKREAGGFGLDGLWNDDFHHTAMIAATGKIEAYYMDYRGTPQEFISALKYGFLYQGQWYQWQKKRRGRPAFSLSANHFVIFLQNHDQVANSLKGDRLHTLTSPGKLRALTALTLLAPSTPMLFQGQEFAASAPFLYFVDLNEELKNGVRKGRQQFLGLFRTIASDQTSHALAEPGSRETFERCKLDFSEREKNGAIYRMHSDLLRIRREDATISETQSLDGAVLGERAFVVRYFSQKGDDRLLLVNLGADLFLNPAPEPLLAPCDEQGWRVFWSSEALEYGGHGTPPLETTSNWIIPGEAAILMGPDERRPLPDVRFSEKD